MQNPDFRLKPSKFYISFLAVTLLASAGIIAALTINVWFKAVLLLILAFYGTYIFRRYALLRAVQSVVGLKQLNHGKWRVVTRSGNVEAELRGDSTVTTIISVLRFDFPNKKQPVTCVIFKDSLAGDDYRRLRVATFSHQ